MDGETSGKSLLSGGEESPQSHFPPSAYLMGGTTKFRWDVFDRGGSVSYRISGSQPGYDSNGAAQRSVAAWTNDPGSNINAAIGGTTSAGFTQDGVSAIVFNSSSAVPAGAIGYSQIFSGGTHSYKGETFYTINEGDVVMRSGLAVSASVFEEAVAHELGHSLGFRHSNEGTPSSSAAIMNSVVSGAYGANLQAWDREAAGHVYTAAVVAPPPPPTGSGVRGDFNADGHTDLIWRNYTTGETHIWLMNRGTYTGSAVLPVIPIAWRIEAVADFNQDGHSDIVWRNYTTGETHIWLMNRTSHAGSAVLSPLALQWELQASGDFNGDNRPDIVWRNITTGQTHIWLMNGVVYGGSVVLPGVSLPWRVEGAADYSGDGSTDIIWRNGTTGETHLWLMSRTVYSGSVVLPPVGAPWDIEGTGDYTQDGRPDIVWRNYGTGETHIWLMNRTVYSGSNVVPFVPTNWRVEGP